MPTTQPMTPIGRAQGYPSFKEAGMTLEKFSSILLRNLQYRTCWSHVTNSAFIKELVNLGDSITVARQPTIQVEPYVKGTPLKIKTRLGQPFKLTMDRASRWGQFYDELDLRRTHVKALTSSTITAAADAVEEQIEREAFDWIGDKAPACNVGNTAGLRSHSYQLGTADHPVLVTRANIAQYLMQFSPVLDETNLKNESGTRSVIMPTIAAYYLRSSEKLLDASQIGGVSSLKTQQLGSLMGIGNIYISNLLEPNELGAFPVIYLAKEAVSYALAAQRTKTKEDPALLDGTLLHGWALYDWGVTREEGISIGWIKPNETALTVYNG